MAFNGTGVASPPNPPTFPAVSGQVIEAAKFNAVINDLYACLTQCVVKDGQTVITGVLQWADKPANLTALGAASIAALDAAVVSLTVPAGIITPFAGSVAPSGWLMCEGQVVSRTTYAALFAAVGTTYGAGDGTTTFNLPDLRGEFIRGLDAGRGVDAGRVLGSSQGPHAGTITVRTYADDGDGDGFGDFKSVSGVLINGQSVFDYYTGANSGVDWTIPVTPTLARPRNVALPYIIKT